ncbi:serine/threonine protein kinase [Actinomadura sp. NEAU-AAG7]|uniref:serine/threonine protein kinase n=1 Tax=Actinomadura sp. NEAU-AAG7 TaxID=2839640 RepID=UPI001BE470C6|nr:serine/threonine protein kinase [Actinomadura sp. NEAU-AAG7]MBT2211482.1 protein kinase [Actinomadura sp. NEAU-AAG7]
MASPLPLDASDPTRLGGCELLGRLGTGGQGVVFLGRPLDPGAGLPPLVAVKLLHTRLLGDEAARARFVRELALLQRVAGFCTAQMLAADTAGDRPYIVSEYVEGRSLNDLVLEEGPRAGADLDRLAISSVTALTAIHRAGIVHRDFKPHNVLMGRDGPRVIDFGIARAYAAGATVTSQVVGTPAYMAPEQFAGRIGPATDLFAWAATLLFAATALDPFAGASVPAVMYRILHETPDLSALPASIAEVAAACLARDPADRPTSEQVLMRLLGESGAPPHAAHDFSTPPYALRPTTPLPGPRTPARDPVPAPRPAPTPDTAPRPAQGSANAPGFIAAPGNRSANGPGPANAPGYTPTNDPGPAPGPGSANAPGSVQGFGAASGYGPANDPGPAPGSVQGFGGASGYNPANDPGLAPGAGSASASGSAQGFGGASSYGPANDSGLAPGPSSASAPGSVQGFGGASGYSPANGPGLAHGPGSASASGPAQGFGAVPGASAPGSARGVGAASGHGSANGPGSGGASDVAWGAGSVSGHGAGSAYAFGRGTGNPPGVSAQGIGSGSADGAFAPAPSGARELRRGAATVAGLVLAGLLAALDVASLAILIARPSLTEGHRGGLLPVVATSFTVLAAVTLVAVILAWRGSRAGAWTAMAARVTRVALWGVWGALVSVDAAALAGHAAVTALVVVLLAAGLRSSPR